MGETCAQSTFEITYDLTGIGPVVQSGEWFAGIDIEEDDNVFYYFGVG